MDFNELSAFVALSESLHFARAAYKVHLSPSALSRLIARLEEELQTQLFERDKRQVNLTNAGKEFLIFARESLLRLEEIELRLSQTDTDLHGTLRVYASVTACYSILPSFVEALTKKYPRVRLSVETGDPAGAANAIRENRAEIAVSAIPGEGFSDLAYHSVRKTPLVFASSKSGLYGNLDLPRTGGPTIFPYPNKKLYSVLSSTPLILPREGLSRQRFDIWSKKIRKLEKKIDHLEITAETAGNEALLALARLGLGLALVPRLVLDNSPFSDGLELYEAGPDFGEYDIGFLLQKIGEGSNANKQRTLMISELIKQTYPESF